MHVYLDGGGHGVAEVVVAGLAGEDAVQVPPGQVLQQQRVHLHTDRTRLGKRISPNTTEIYNCVV